MSRKQVLRKIADPLDVRSFLIDSSLLIKTVKGTLLIDGIAAPCEMSLDFPTADPTAIELRLSLSTPPAVGKTVWLDFELFERCYRARCQSLDSFDQSVFISMPDLLEEISPRNARRIGISSGVFRIGINSLSIGNISELGALLVGTIKSPVETTTGTLTIEDQTLELSFRVAECNEDRTRIEFVHSEQSRPLLAELLIPYKYPTLRLRAEDDYMDIWSLFKSTGYLRLREDPGYFEEQKEMLFAAWQQIDSRSPRIDDVTVVSRSGKDIVASIGNAQYGAYGLYGHSIAFTVSPDCLQNSQECYLWHQDHTMANLPDNGICLASMNTKTKFHDRFYYRFQYHFKDQVACPYYWIYAYKPSLRESTSNHVSKFSPVTADVALRQAKLSKMQSTIAETLKHLMKGTQRAHWEMSQYDIVVFRANYLSGISMSGFHEAIWLFLPEIATENAVMSTIESVKSTYWLPLKGLTIHVVPFNCDSASEPLTLTPKPTYTQLNRLFICEKRFVPSYYGHALRVFNEMAQKYKT